jgi:hypothetical protein
MDDDDYGGFLSQPFRSRSVSPGDLRPRASSSLGSTFLLADLDSGRGGFVRSPSSRDFHSDTLAPTHPPRNAAAFRSSPMRMASLPRARFEPSRTAGIRTQFSNQGWGGSSAFLTSATLPLTRFSSPCPPPAHQYEAPPLPPPTNATMAQTLLMFANPPMVLPNTRQFITQPPALSSLEAPICPWCNKEPCKSKDMKPRAVATRLQSGQSRYFAKCGDCLERQYTKAKPSTSGRRGGETPQLQALPPPPTPPPQHSTIAKLYASARPGEFEPDPPINTTKYCVMQKQAVSDRTCMQLNLSIAKRAQDAIPSEGKGEQECVNAAVNACQAHHEHELIACSLDGCKTVIVPRRTLSPHGGTGQGTLEMVAANFPEFDFVVMRSASVNPESGEAGDHSIGNILCAPPRHSLKIRGGPRPLDARALDSKVEDEVKTVTRELATLWKKQEKVFNLPPKRRKVNRDGKVATQLPEAVRPLGDAEMQAHLRALPLYLRGLQLRDDRSKAARPECFTCEVHKLGAAANAQKSARIRGSVPFVTEDGWSPDQYPPANPERGSQSEQVRGFCRSNFSRMVGDLYPGGKNCAMRHVTFTEDCKNSDGTRTHNLTLCCNNHSHHPVPTQVTAPAVFCTTRVQ